MSGRRPGAGKTEQKRVAVIERHAQQEAEGKSRGGRGTRAILTEPQALLARMSAVAERVDSLCQK